MSPTPMERRRFLRLAGLAAGATVLRPSFAFGQEVPPASDIDSVLVMTSVRDSQLSVRVDYFLATPAPASSIVVQVAELNGSTAGLPSGTFPLAQTLPGQHRQEVSLAWASPHLWDVNAGYLYTLHVRIERGLGPVLAYPPIKFGFREVWRDGKHMMLNDHPLKLRQVPFIGTVPQMHFYGGMGMNAIEFQPNPGSWGQYPPIPFPGGASNVGSIEMFDHADANGWCIFMPTVGVGFYLDAMNTEPQVADVWMAQVKLANKEWNKQNRPSIIAWVPVMNAIGNLATRRHTNNPEEIGREPTPVETPPWAATTISRLKQEDPTRLVVFHEAGSLSDAHFGNVYLNIHALQEREDHLSKWATDGSLPWGAAEFGPPSTAPMFKYRFGHDATSDGLPYFTEFFAEYFGDLAYTSENDDYVTDVTNARASTGAATFAWGENFSAVGGLDRLGETTAYYKFIDLFIRNTNKAWRGWGGNAGWHPWIQDIGFGHDPSWTQGGDRWFRTTYANMQGGAELESEPSWANDVYRAYRATLQPLLVFLGGPASHFTKKDHHYTPGETAQRTVVLIWDGAGQRTVNAAWTLKEGSTPVPGASGNASFTLAPGTVERHAISFTVPNRATRTDFTLQLEATVVETGAVLTDTASITVFPAASVGTRTSTWRIYDPKGKTTSELAAIGFNPASVALGADLTGVDVLIVGAGALDVKAPDGSTALPASAADVENGLRVLMFEQSADALHLLGLRTEDVVPRYTFPRVTDHPALAGVAPQNLINWRGGGNLVAEKKANSFPYADRRMHWGNRGSVASVVIETPHQGAFTPILESCFDLSFSPLLEWRHGTGTVVFCQLDVTGRVEHDPADPAPATVTERDPAAQHVIVGLLDYLDAAPAGSSADREIAFIGANADDQALLDDIGFVVRNAAPGSLALQAGEIVVVGRDAVSTLSTSDRQALESHVQAGGTAVFLPRTSAEMSATSWPWTVTTSQQSLARVAASGSSPYTRGMGPQLLRWRSFQQFDVIAPAGLPTGSDRLLDGLVGHVADSAGHWIVSQYDWRSLTTGGNNTRRPRWNARKFYRQLLTNVGAISRPVLAEGLLRSSGFPAMTPVGPWRIIAGQQIGAAPADASGGYCFKTPPGLDEVFHQDGWSGATGTNWGTLQSPDANGYVALDGIVTRSDPNHGPNEGSTAYARTYVYSTNVRTATFSFGPAYWSVFKVNGQIAVDDTYDGNTVPTRGIQQPTNIGVTLQAGWNKLEVGVCGAATPLSYRDVTTQRLLGFHMHTEDPGDLVVNPADTDPTSPPPSPGAPQYAPAPIDLYMEDIPRPEDVYRFNAY